MTKPIFEFSKKGIEQACADLWGERDSSVADIRRAANPTRANRIVVTRIHADLVERDRERIDAYLKEQHRKGVPNDKHAFDRVR